MTIQTVNNFAVAQSLANDLNTEQAERGNAYHTLKLAFPKLSAEQAKALSPDVKVAIATKTGFVPMSQSQVKTALASGERISREQLKANAMYKSFQNLSSLLKKATALDIDYMTLSVDAVAVAVKAKTPDADKPVFDVDALSKAFTKAILSAMRAGIDADTIFEAFTQSTQEADGIITDELARQLVVDEINAVRADASPAYTKDEQRAIFMAEAA